MKKIQLALSFVVLVVALLVLFGRDLILQAQSYAITVYAARIGVSDTQQHTVPVVASDTFTLNAATQTLTNKTLTTPTIASILNGAATLTLPTTTDTLVGRATTDTLTNKTVNLTSNTLSGTTAQFNTALSDNDFLTQAGTETFSNKSFSNLLTGTINAIGAAISNILLINNTTAATNPAQVQNSPTLKFSGTGWTGAASQTVSGEIYVNPFPAATVVPIFTFDTVDGAGTRTTVMGITPANVSYNGSITANSGTITAAAGGAFILNGRSRLQSGADGRFTLNNNAANSGLELTFGADVTVTTCGTGTVTAGSKNSAGEITATGATACTVTFASPTFNNSPFCVANDETTAAPLVVNVTGTASMTVTNLTAGDKFFYHCIGRF